MPVKARSILALGVILSFAAVITVEEYRLFKASEDYANLNNEFLQYKLDAEVIKTNALNAAAEETERRLNQQKAISDDYIKTIDRLNFDKRNANAIAARLRKSIKQLSKSSNSNQASDTTATRISNAKITAEKLGDLATMADRAAGKLAKELDEAITRGKTCQRLYTSLTEGSDQDGPERVN